MTAVLPAEPLVDGLLLDWVWANPRGELPAGVLIDHGDHKVLVLWSTYAGGPSAPAFTLDSLLPLSVLEDVICGCGMVGRIELGAWRPAKGGGGRG